MKELDVRGLSCPVPVLKTKELIEKERPAELVVIVDNEAAMQNVSRFLSSQGFSVTTEKEKDGIRIRGIFEDKACISALQTEEAQAKKTLIMITNDRIGHGDDELGKKLMQNFINTLKEMEGLWRIVFMNNGVKLTTKGSKLIPTLKELNSLGIQILVCGTCLNHFGLLDKKEIGETTNMLDIVTSLQLADKIIQV